MSTYKNNQIKICFKCGAHNSIRTIRKYFKKTKITTYFNYCTQCDLHWKYQKEAKVNISAQHLRTHKEIPAWDKKMRNKQSQSKKLAYIKRLQMKRKPRIPRYQWQRNQNNPNKIFYFY